MCKKYSDLPIGGIEDDRERNDYGLRGAGGTEKGMHDGLVRSEERAVGEGVLGEVLTYTHTNTHT